MNDFSASIELSTVCEDIWSQFSFSELLKTLNELDHFLLGVIESLVGNWGLRLRLLDKLRFWVVGL